MRRVALPLFVIVAAGPAAAADWGASAKECSALISAQTSPRCGSCAALWPQISKCAADAQGIDPARTDDCVTRVNNDNWAKPMYFDRVSAVIACLSK